MTRKQFDINKPVCQLILLGHKIKKKNDRLYLWSFGILFLGQQNMVFMVVGHIIY